VLPYAQTFAAKNLQCRKDILDGCRIRTSNKGFNEWLTRSEADLRMLIEGNPEGAYPYAGVPWFNTVFGRDGIITAMECLWIAPSIAEGESKYLASTQATATIHEQDAAPGKMVLDIFYGLYQASTRVELNRLPELFCGFHKRADSSGPTLYPVACSPQAWAAGSIFCFLAALGISIRAPERTMRFSNPALPRNLDELTIENLRVADASVDLFVRRHPEGVGVQVTRREGDLEVVKSV
jgi:glycogen debranching enzyme